MQRLIVPVLFTTTLVTSALASADDRTRRPESAFAGIAEIELTQQLMTPAPEFTHLQQVALNTQLVNGLRRTIELLLKGNANLKLFTYQVLGIQDEKIAPVPGHVQAVEFKRKVYVRFLRDVPHAMAQAPVLGWLVTIFNKDQVSYQLALETHQIYTLDPINQGQLRLSEGESRDLARAHVAERAIALEDLRIHVQPFTSIGLAPILVFPLNAVQSRIFLDLPDACIKLLTGPTSDSPEEPEPTKP